MSTLFDYLPGDVLQYEINKFLLPLERVTLNQAALHLSPGERLSKKLPSDYVIKHHNLVVKRIANKLSKSINIICNSSYHGDAHVRKHHLKPLLSLYRKLFAVLKNPLNRSIYMYDSDAREAILTTCENTGFEYQANSIYYSFWREMNVLETIDNPITKDAQEIINIINGTPFEREIYVSQETFVSVYA
jgi:hypothetical protein